MKRHRHTLRPSLEALEVRDTPAGTVAATFAGGRMTLSGDAASNAVAITQRPDGRLVISGEGTQFQLNGGPAEGTITLPARVSGGVAINLADGADVVLFDGVDLPGGLTINGGNGSADGVTGNVARLKNVRVRGGLTITNLAGVDITELWGAVEVGGGLAVRNGSGGSELRGDETTDLRVGGLFSVTGGTGFDKVDLWQAAAVAVGGLAFNSGPDADGGYFRINPAGDLTVAGGVQVTNGGGEDRTQLGGQNIAI